MQKTLLFIKEDKMCSDSSNLVEILTQKLNKSELVKEKQIQNI